MSVSSSNTPVRPVAPQQTPSAIQRAQQIFSIVRNSAAPVGTLPKPSALEKGIDTLATLANNDDPIFTIADVPAYIDALKNSMSTGIDDHLLLLEKLLVVMSRLPEDSEFSKTLQKFTIILLFKDLPHPPNNFLALPSPLATGQKLNPTVHTQDRRVSYAFRPADGTDYNPFMPSLGAAGQPYARSVPGLNQSPAHALPDAGLLFDTLLRRPADSGNSTGFKKHPDGISSLFFAFADLVIHSIFNTDHANPTINKASSYLDLSVLYGSSDADIQKIRRNDGSGKLWEDVFADSRLLSMPPSACALLVLMCRNHNYIATKILDINERETFRKNPFPRDAAEKQAQDDEIFQRTRLVNAAYFMQIILGDYVGAILGLARDGYSWRLDPLQVIREVNHELSPRGEGNAVSIEFNLLYRWHATISEQDTKWTEQAFANILPKQSFDAVTPDDFVRGVHQNLRPDADPRKWTFGGLERDATGRFSDAKIAEIIQNATEWTAGAFGARNTPAVMRVIEIMAIESSRSWGACTLNEFRQFIGLKAYDSFEEWNKDPEVWKPAAALYKDINNLELHVGLQAEQSKEPGPGAGLCPGYTISRTILADAVCLTRGDRFLTTDMTPYNLTPWGYDDCQFSRTDGSYGGMLTKLLFRTLPDYYPAGSAYAHFPFLVPSTQEQHMRKSIRGAANVDKYTWTRPPVPGSVTVINDYDSAKFVLENTNQFVALYNQRINKITGGVRLNRSLVGDVILKPKMELERYFHTLTKELIKSKSVPLGDDILHLDVVKDVINLLPVHWIATQVIGIPLKEALHNPGGTIPEETLYRAMADVCNYVHLNFDPADDWTLRESSQKTYDENVSRIKEHLKSFSLTDALLQFTMSSNNTDPFIEQLLSSAKVPGVAPLTADELASSVFMHVVPTAAHFSQSLAHVVNFFLDEDKEAARLHIVDLSTRHTHEAEREIMSYVREALRLNPIVSDVYRTAAVDAMIGTRTVKAGDRVLISLINANLDTDAFGPQPAEPVYSRPTNKAGILGVGELGLLSSKFFDKVVPGVLGIILGLKGLKRQGLKGGLKQFTQQWHSAPERLYFDSKSKIAPWPTTLEVQYIAI